MQNHLAFQDRLVKIAKDNQSTVDPITLNVRDANGNLIKTYGSLVVPIEFNGKIFSQRSVICDIGKDGILGHDFLLRYVSNYKQHLQHTYQGDIQCQMYGKSDMTCRIEVRRTTSVPPHSGIWLPVDKPGCEGLTKYGYAETVQNKHDLSVFPGVLDLNVKQVSIVNSTEEPITLHAKQHKGVCESYIDSKIKRVNQVIETVSLDTQKPTKAQLPTHH